MANSNGQEVHFTFVGLEKHDTVPLQKLSEALVMKSRRMRWAGYVARMEEGRSDFKILTGKPKGKRPLGRPRGRWEHNIRMDLK